MPGLLVVATVALTLIGLRFARAPWSASAGLAAPILVKHVGNRGRPCGTHSCARGAGRRPPCCSAPKQSQTQPAHRAVRLSGHSGHSGPALARRRADVEAVTGISLPDPSPWWDLRRTRPSRQPVRVLRSMTRRPRALAPTVRREQELRLRTQPPRSAPEARAIALGCLLVIASMSSLDARYTCRSPRVRRRDGPGRHRTSPVQVLLSDRRK